MGKIGRNEKCPCNSGTKYKNCCLMKEMEERRKKNNMYVNGHDTKSESLLTVMTYLKNIYKKYNIINISDYLDNNAYREYQIKNYNIKTIMVAERNDRNNEVFTTRGPNEVNIMVMFHGAYKCFSYSNLELAKYDVEQMINKRL